MGQIRVFPPVGSTGVALFVQVLAQRRADGPAALPGGERAQPADQSIVVAGPQAELRSQLTLRPQGGMGLRQRSGVWGWWIVPS